MKQSEWDVLVMLRQAEYFSTGRTSFNIAEDKIDIISLDDGDQENPSFYPEVELRINGIKQYQDPEYLDGYYSVFDIFDDLKDKYVE